MQHKIYAGENGKLGWQSPVIAKDLSPLNRGSNPLPSYEIDYHHPHRQPFGLCCTGAPRSGIPYLTGAKSVGVYTVAKRSKHCGPLWSPSTHRRWCEIIHQRTRSPFHFFSYIIPASPSARTNPSPRPMGPDTSSSFGN